MARSFAWQAYKRTISRPLTMRVYDTMRLRLQPGSGSCSNFVYFGDRFEYNGTGFALAYLRSGDNVIDGGANIGAYTLLAASVVATGRVDSFEPSAEHAKWLKENVELNRLRNVQVHEAAITESSATLHFSADMDVSNRVVGSDYPGETRVVRGESIGRLLAERPYALVKLDLEGHEHAALIGASQELQRGNPAVFLIELMEWQLRKAGSSVAAVCDLLRSALYELYLYDADTNTLTRVSGLPRRRDNNLVAVHTCAMPSVEERLGRPRIIQ